MFSLCVLEWQNEEKTWGRASGIGGKQFYVTLLFSIILCKSPILLKVGNWKTKGAWVASFLAVVHGCTWILFLAFLLLTMDTIHRNLISWNNSLTSARIVMMLLGILKEKSEKPAVTIYIKNCRDWWLSRGGSSVFRALVAQSRRPELDSSWMSTFHFS